MPSFNAAVADLVGHYEAGDRLYCFGFSRLNLRLDPFGAPGCFLLSDCIVAFPRPLNNVGSSSLQVQVPNNPTLLRVKFTNQGAIADVVNNLRIVTTRGGEGQIGR